MDYKLAHDRSRYNREQLANCTLCGCFSCMRLYDPAEITEWVDEPEGKVVTALCPYCHTDAVLASTADFPVTAKMLQEMHWRWFGAGSGKVLGKLIPDEAQVAILQKGVEAWNAWRTAHLEQVPNLDGAVLKGLNLRRADLQGAHLRQADLRDTDLSYANLQKASLQFADVRGARLEHTNLNRANCKEADFAHASLLAANLSHVDLGSADLSHIDGTEVDLRDADLSSADLHDATLHYADCSDANFFDASLFKADLAHADLKGADFSQARLQQAQLTDANLNWSRLIMTDITGAVLRQCSVHGVFIWNIQSQAVLQRDLVFAYPDPRSDASTLVTDDLLYAYFIATLLANPQMDSIVRTSIMKGVLLLGDWLNEQEERADAIKDVLRDEGYMPIAFHDHMLKNRERVIEIVIRLSSSIEYLLIDLSPLNKAIQILPAVLPHMAAPIFVLCHASIAIPKELEVLAEMYSKKLLICKYNTIIDVTVGVHAWLQSDFGKTL